MAGRPKPPRELFDVEARVSFLPAPDMSEWLRETFIEDSASLRNDDHAHLEFAVIGVLWAGVENKRRGRRILGTAELGRPPAMMGKWQKARVEQQLEEWFGEIPDFLITLDAFGQPKFTQLGKPKFAMRGHDIEEFVGVVRRYGPSAAGVQELVDAANRRPEVALANIANACGTCLLRAA